MWLAIYIGNPVLEKCFYNVVISYQYIYHNNLVKKKKQMTFNLFMIVLTSHNFQNTFVCYSAIFFPALLLSYYFFHLHVISMW